MTYLGEGWDSTAELVDGWVERRPRRPEIGPQLLRESVDTLGQTTVMVTHDAHAAAIADRVVFLADGHIVRDLGPSSAHEILEALEQLTQR